LACFLRTMRHDREAREEACLMLQDVLIVDDQPDIRHVLTDTLRDAGYRVITAADGRSALSVLVSNPHPLVVLLDFMMPGMNGQGMLEVVVGDAELRVRHAYILMTAMDRIISPALQVLVTELGAPLLRKPFDEDVLLALVQKQASRD